MPGSVKTAAILWIVFGGLGLLGQLFSLMTVGIRGSGIFGLAVSIAFVVFGIQILKGGIRDTIGPAIASIVLGCIGVVGLLVLMSGFRSALAFVLLVGLVNSGGLVLAGILALTGRSGYRRWRSATYF